MPASTPSILAILSHTPIWVWGLFALLLLLGYLATRDRTMPIWRVLLLPAVMATLFATSVVGGGLAALPAILTGLAVGGVTGFLLELGRGTRRLPDGRLSLRGEWWSLGQIVASLAIHYVTAVVSAIDPALAANQSWHLGTLFISSTVSALFLGRAAVRLRIYLAAPPVAA